MERQRVEQEQATNEEVFDAQWGGGEGKDEADVENFPEVEKVPIGGVTDKKEESEDS